MIDKDTLELWKEWSKRGDWHLLFVGSDIRQMLGEIDRLREANLKAAFFENKIPWPDPTTANGT